MTGKVKIFWILYGLVLAALFLVSSTDLIIKEGAAKVYPISVIVEDTSDENYVNFRKGMERAAVELNGDVSFITLYEKGNVHRQRELILREQEDGACALVVAPVDPEMLAGMQQENRFLVPLVLVNTRRDEARELENAACVSFDFYGMGRRLGEEILKEDPSRRRVCILSGGRPDGADRLFSEGLWGALQEAGCEVLTFEGDNQGRHSPDPAGEEEAFPESGPEAFLEAVTQGYSQKAVLVAVNQESLVGMAQLLTETEGTAQWVDGLYGRGNTVPILNYLDRGVIQGLCVTDDFSAGYLSVKAAVELAEKGSVQGLSSGDISGEGTGYLESYYIRREDLRNETYEKMLYPVE